MKNQYKKGMKGTLTALSLKSQKAMFDPSCPVGLRRFSVTV